MYDKEKMISMIRERRFSEANRYCEDNIANNHYRDFLVLYFMIKIALAEEDNGESCIFDISDDCQVWLKHFHQIKFLVRRLEILQLKPYEEELFSYMKKYHVSETAVTNIIRYSTNHHGKVSQKFHYLYQKAQKKEGIAVAGSK